MEKKCENCKYWQEVELVFSDGKMTPNFNCQKKNKWIESTSYCEEWKGADDE